MLPGTTIFIFRIIYLEQQPDYAVPYLPQPDSDMHRTAYILLLLTMLFWAGNAIAGKFAIGHVSPMILVAARWSLTLIILVVIGRRQLVKDWPVIRPRLWLLILLGTLGFAVFSAFMYGALLYTSATNVSIEQGGMPLFVFAASFIMYRTRVIAAQVLGFGLSLLGVIVTAIHGDIQHLINLDLNYGDALMMVAIAAYGIYTASLRRKPKIHWISLIACLCLGGALSSIPLVIAEAAAGATVLPDATGWAIIAYVVLFPSLIGQAFFIRGVELIGPNRAGLFINFLPLWGALLSVVVLGEVFQPYHALALVLVLGGVLIAEYNGRKIAVPLP